MKVHACVRTAVAVAVAVMGLGVAGAARAEDAQFTATASLNNLQVWLYNLAPATNASLWVNFGGPNGDFKGTADASGVDVLNAEAVPVGVQARGFTFDPQSPTLSQSTTSLDGRGSVSVTSNSYTASATIGTADVQPSAYWPGALQAFGNSLVKTGNEAMSFPLYTMPDEATGRLVVSGVDSYNQLNSLMQNITLSPHTQMVLTGEAALRFAMVGQLDGSWHYVDQSEGGFLTADSYVMARVGMTIQRVNPITGLAETYGSRDEFNADVALQYGIDGQEVMLEWLIEQDAKPGDVVQNLTIKLTNDSDAPLQAILGTSVAAHVSLWANSTVPEPGTWALMGLGLVGLMGASRRRAARA